jgi:hypothetical protein
MWRTSLLSAIAIFAVPSAASSAELQFTDLWARPYLNSIVSAEFGTAELPPLSDFTGHYYRVAGEGPQSLEFRYQVDEGSLTPEFGYYRVSPALLAIDVSTDEGKRLYAQTALAPGNAEVVFQDARESPVKIEMIALSGGELIGFFSIPRLGVPHGPFRYWLEEFQASPERSTLEGRDSGLGESLFAGGRWPQFSYTPANAGAYDQMLSLSGPSGTSGDLTTMLFWEDASQLADADPWQPGAFFYDGDFNDAVYVVSGVVPVPEPNTNRLVAMLAAALAACNAKTFAR